MGAKQKTVRVGIIGAGLMGREFASAAARWMHLNTIGSRPEIVAVAGRAIQTCDWFTDNIPSCKKATDDYRDLLSDDSIDAIYCAVPHNLHQTIYCDVIRAGKHLFGEKPFGIDAPANAAIVAEANKRPDVVVRCNSQFPYFPGAQRIIKAIAENALGTIIDVEAGFLHSSDLDPRKPMNWKRQVEINGEYGCLGDLGMHALHIPLRAGWYPKNIRAILTNVRPFRPDATGALVPCETFDNATLFCEVNNETGRFPLTIKTWRIAPGEMDTWYLRVTGDKLSMRFSTKQPRTLETLRYDTPGETQVWRVEDIGYSSVYPAVTGGIFEFGFTDAILQVFASFIDQVVRGNDATLPFGCATLDETRQHHQILTAALESNRTRSTVSL
ncbi:MAG: Gfo/Idh/MocA family oxidoreductase [Planctomycetota bacterium]